ncbi:MAG: HEAT repeat domain-containing protein [Chloroflexi bacterium]|nr:MAG: HEAT repeat domain-containing protein [Chloroflexota bacterium]TMF04528.1 MAG: HEAT repeat domain-containing protein [Chloroflexota bacterium]TMG23425.1 MAG: HEAT repeat domain-containing protein [Chloroflexota bacterium]
MSRGPLEPARLAIHRSLVRRHIHSVVAGKADRLNVDLADRDVDPARMLIEAAASLDRGGVLYTRLEAAVGHPSFANRVIDGLGSRHPVVRARCARIAGAFQMEQAVPLIAPLLWSNQSLVRNAATRALGVIGGVRSADALLAAIQRLGPKPALVVALARAAPDLYLETVLSRKQPRGVQPAVATAAGLRRRKSAVAPIVGQMSDGSPRLRAAGGRALGWIGAPAAIPVLVECLENTDWRVRLSAAKALGNIKDFQPGSQMLAACLVDRNARVRSAAQCALRRHGRVPNMFAVRG